MTDKQTHKIDWTPLGFPDPSVGINKSRRWNPTLVILLEIVNIRSIKTIELKKNWQKGLWTTIQTGGLLYYTSTQGILNRGQWLHALCAIVI